MLEGTRRSAALSSLPGLVLPCYRCALQPHLPPLLLETHDKRESRCPNKKEGMSTQNSEGYCTGRTFLDIGMQTAGPQPRTCLTAETKTQSSSADVLIAVRRQPWGVRVGQ